MSDRWGVVRRLATEAGEAARHDASAEGLALARAALASRGLEIVRCYPDDPLLCGAKGVYTPDYVAYDRSFGDPQAAWILAHELGHAILHDDLCQCTEQDISEEPVTAHLPYGAGAIDVYNPRQRRELEANVFAAAFLLPAEKLRTRFLAGASFQNLATDFGVSPTAALNALANTLLSPLSSELEAAGEPQESAPLDPSQAAAAQLEQGPVLINAGPGTGKTRTLVARIGQLLGQGISAHQILAVTFSNRAAGEMRERLTVMVPEQVHGLTICTFHAFCLEILRRHHDLIGLPANFSVVDQVDAIVLLQRNLARLPLKHYRHVAIPGFYLKPLVQAISRAKDELVDPGQYALLAAAAQIAAGEDPEAQTRAAKWAEVAAVYAIYEQLLLERGVIDFGGLMTRTVALLEERPDILAQLQQEYPHILVDEYQDMNRVSSHLLQLLAGDGRGLWVVGDLRQAIYQFRGASPANITNFTRDFPGGSTIDLGINYRSDPHLVALLRAAGAALVTDEIPAPTWEAFWPGDPPPRVWVAEAEDEAAEGRGIADEIVRRQRNGRLFREQAILVRTHGQAKAIVTELERANIPALYLGDLFARDEIRDLLSLVALAAGDGVGLFRVGEMPEHHLPREDRAQLIRFAHERNERFPAALALATEAGLQTTSASACNELHSALATIGWQASPWQFLARYLFGRGALVRRLLREDSVVATQKLMAIGQLLAIARAFAERPLGPEREGQNALRAFLNHVRHLVASGDNVVRLPAGGEDLDAVRILTVHAAKGTEFPVVYVTNLATKRFPFRGMPDSAPPPPGLITADSDDGLLEEARLFFVAISRAKHELVLSRATRYGKTKYEPSPLLGLVEPFFATDPPQHLCWTGEEELAPPIPEVPVVLERVLDIAEVEAYQRCPRQWEYRYGLGLREQDELLGYRRFQGSVFRVLRLMRELHRNGELPDAARATKMLAEEWEKSGPRDDVYEPVYRELGNAIISRVWQGLNGLEPVQPWLTHLEVELGGATVRVRLDDSEDRADGTIRISRMHVGEPRVDDRKAPRLALIRAGAGQRLGGREKVAIELEYSASGEVVSVKDGKAWEDKRVDALADAVEGILAGHYPPRPKQPHYCETCPYWMICPA